jgi:hypothetical protein
MFPLLSWEAANEGKVKNTMSTTILSISLLIKMRLFMALAAVLPVFHFE